MSEDPRGWKVVTVILFSSFLVSSVSTTAIYNARGWEQSAERAHDLRRQLDSLQGQLDTVPRCDVQVADLVAPHPDDYPAERFEQDCADVCMAHWSHDPPGRVLMVDPSQLVCVCLHPDTPWPLTRWEGWTRPEWRQQ